MSQSQCGFCSSPLGHRVTVWGVERVVCDGCFGFMMRWSNDAEPRQEPSEEVKKVLAKAASFMKHRAHCRAERCVDNPCSCGMDLAIEQVANIHPAAKPGGLACT